MSSRKPAASFADVAASSLLVFDGAMGSLLYERGVFVSQNFEQLNVTRPDIVGKIHADYVGAGANVIETNTFGANRFRLERHGLVGEVRAYNLAGARLAREAAGESAYVAGSMGPTGLVLGVAPKSDRAAAFETFAEQAAALVEGGSDLLILETFRHLDEITIAIEAAQKAAPGTPLIASMTFDMTETVADGSQPEHVANYLRDRGVFALGVNCGDGPQLSLGVAARMRVAGLPLCVQPNAGLPRTVDGRLLYMATPEYFDVFARRMIQAGATMVGGCCGTTPEHVRWMVKSSRMLGGGESHITDATPAVAHEVATGLEPVPIAERSVFAAKIASGKFVVSVEVNPAPGLDPKPALEAAKMLIDSGVDIVNVADGPRAMARMANIAFCSLLIERYGIDPILHVCGRDRNLLAQMAHLLGAHAIGIRNLVVITGDPPKVGDYPEAMDTYDIVPSGLIKLITQKMNSGVDQAGNSIGQPTSYTVGCALNMGADDLDKEIDVLIKKLAAGADFALGQPVFEPPKVERFLARYQEIAGEPLKMPVLMGVMPLYSIRHATFIDNEIPGISIPPAILKRIEDAGEDAAQEGVRIAQELLRDLKDFVQGAYIIPAFGRYELAAQIIDAVAVG